jgi:hypothetical protein
MNRLVVVAAGAAIAAVGLGGYSTASAYTATANVTFAWSEGGTHIGWTSSGVNAFPDPAIAGNNTLVFAAGGNNSTSYYNPDFAIASDYTGSTSDDCVTLLPDYEAISLRKYSCRQTDAEGYYSPVYNPVPVADQSNGAAATGTLNVSDTTLTGTLTVVSTTDEPTGATTAFLSGVRTSNSAGDGFDGFNVRTADGSPFGNAWYGITTSATLTVNLTGTFTNGAWTINGGAVTISDPGFACQQGGFGGTGAGTLCTPSTTGGGFQTTGGQLSWGMDTDGAGTGQTLATPIQVRDTAGAAVLTTLSGVRADLTLDGGGNLTQTAGEFRFASGSAGGGCLDHIRWGGDTDPGAGTSIGISCGTLASGPLTISGVATEVLPDTTPDQFTFVDQTDVAFSSAITSAAVTITGINAAANVTVTGGEYSVGCTGTFTSTAGTINNNQTVCVRHTSAATGSTATNTTLDVGGVSDVFTSTTVAADTTPDAFSFVDQTDVALSTAITSAAVTITGINTAAAVTVTGGEYSVGCTGTFTSSAGTINNGQTICARHTSSAAFSTAVNTTVTVGGVSDIFTSTTLAEDTTPAAFSFVDQTNVALSTVITSAAVTITGINSAAPVTVTNGEYSVGCTGTFTAAAGTITIGQTVCVRHTSSAAFSTAVNTVLDVGTVTDTFSSTTVAADTTPDAFSFVDQTGVAVDTAITSAAVTIAGINTAAPVSVTGGEYSVGCTGTFTAANGTINNGQTVCVRHTSATTGNTATNTVLTIGGVGGVADTFTSTTGSTSTGLREDDGGSSLDALILALLGFAAAARRRVRRHD